MSTELLIWIALFVSAAGWIIYLVYTLKGCAKPNRVTYFLWAAMPMIAFAAELEKGVGLIAFFTFVNGFFPALILISSFLIKEAYWKLARFDYVMAALAFVGVILWQITGEGNLAIAFVIFADGCAALPTIKKAYLQPQTENKIAYIFIALSALITLVAIEQWFFAYYAFPLYLLTVYTAIVVAIMLGNRRFV